MFLLYYTSLSHNYHKNLVRNMDIATSEKFLGVPVPL